MLYKYLAATLKGRYARHLNLRGDDLWRKGEVVKAEASFRAAIRTDKTFALPYSNLGALLMNLHRYDEGFGFLQRAAHLDPNHPGILVNLGNAFMRAGRVQQAVSLYQDAVKADPENTTAAASLLRPLMDICDWDGLDRHFGHIQERIAAGREINPSRLITPYNSLFLPLTRQEQLSIATNAAREYLKAAGKAQRGGHDGTIRKSERIRIGYLSSDYHDHATSHLTLGIYGLHDRACFEVYAYSIGTPDTSSYRQKIASDCDRFIDVHDLTTRQIADRIAADKIDILVDMKGYTGDSRPGILALRPAPIQVNYLGYPGTMGASFIDFLIADPIIIPTGHSADYSEEIIRLPDTYQPTNDKQFISEKLVNRRLAGLPENGVVFCCFNAPAKIDKRSFSCWMKILSAVPNSVLWLMNLSPDAAANLASASRAAGIDPARLIYAQFLAKPEHLARLQLADLVLDSFIYNAHTTATDALWAGVPIVTLTGETFASRVATSLLTAVGLGELATKSEADYVALAVNLATNHDRLANLKAFLRNKTDKPLFNTAQYVSNLDDAYKEMFSRRIRKTN